MSGRREARTLRVKSGPHRGHRRRQPGGRGPESPPQPTEASSSQTRGHSSPGLRLPPHRVPMCAGPVPGVPVSTTASPGCTWAVTTSCPISGGSPSCQLCDPLARFQYQAHRKSGNTYCHELNPRSHQMIPGASEMPLAAPGGRAGGKSVGSWGV